jgi:hypothetical protein
MEDFPPEKPGIAWTVYLVAIAGLLAICLMALLHLTPKAHAQDGQICAPAEVLFRQYESVVKEHVIWEGTMPIEGQPPIQFVLFQNEKGNWTLFVVNAQGIACLSARGDAGTPNEMGKGT